MAEAAGEVSAFSESEGLALLRPRARWRAALHEPQVLAGLVIVGALVLGAVLAPLLAPQDPLHVDPVHALQGPSLAHPLGTDGLGRDLFSRVLIGSRASLGTAVLAAAVVLALGTCVGLVAGLTGGWLDGLLMRLVDAVLAFPSLILVLAIAGTVGGGLAGVLLGITATWWASYARLVRGLVAGLRELPFVEAARAMGARPVRIAVRHILPALVADMVVLLTLEMGGVILAISGLAFVGIGTQPPAPEWGAMLNDAWNVVLVHPSLMLPPGIALLLTVLGLNLLGDGLRDALDPKGGSRPGFTRTRFGQSRFGRRQPPL